MGESEEDITDDKAESDDKAKTLAEAKAQTDDKAKTLAEAKVKALAEADEAKALAEAKEKALAEAKVALAEAKVALEQTAVAVIRDELLMTLTGEAPVNKLQIKIKWGQGELANMGSLQCFLRKFNEIFDSDGKTVKLKPMNAAEDPYICVIPSAEDGETAPADGDGCAALDEASDEDCPSMDQMAMALAPDVD